MRRRVTADTIRPGDRVLLDPVDPGTAVTVAAVERRSFDGRDLIRISARRNIDAVHVVVTATPWQRMTVSDGAEGSPLPS